MTDRALGVVAAAAGMVLVTLLMLRGVDLARAAATGPRWRRRLVAAGIAVLTACGVQAETYEPPPSFPTCYVMVGPVSQTQRTVEELRAQFYFLQCQLKAGAVTTDTVSVAMRTLEEDIRVLADTAAFAVVPAGWQPGVRQLLQDAPALLAEVRARREELAATAVAREAVIAPFNETASLTSCYSSAMPRAVGQEWVMKLSLQVALLRQQLEAGTITNATAQVITGTIEGDLCVLGDAGVFGSIPSDEQDEAQRKIREAQVLLAEVKAMMGTPAQLAANREWQEYIAVRGEAERCGANLFDQAGKTKILDDLRAAAEKLDTLAAAGLLTAPEAELLKKNLAELTDGVKGFWPSDMPMVPCYAPMPMRSLAEKSMTRVNDRIVLLRQLVEQGAVHGEVVRPVIDDLRADIATLNAPANIQRLPAAQRAGAEKARQAAEQALADIERLLAGQE